MAEMNQEVEHNCGKEITQNIVESLWAKEEENKHQLRLVLMNTGGSIIYCTECSYYLETRTRLLLKPCKGMTGTKKENKDRVMAQRRIQHGMHPESHASKSIRKTKTWRSDVKASSITNN